MTPEQLHDWMTRNDYEIVKVESEGMGYWYKELPDAEQIDILRKLT